ncbi:MAG: methyl-accepting chemotaxis protein [Actinomycetes bacterium]
MDFARVVTRVSGVCALVYALLNPVSLWLLASQDPQIGGQVVVLAAASMLVLLGAVWFLLRPELARRIPVLDAYPLVVDVAQMTFFVAVIVVLTVNGGGLEGLQWFYLIFVVIFSAMTMPTSWALAMGLLSAGGFITSVAVTGDLDVAHAGQVLSASVGLLLLGVFAAALAGALRKQEALASTSEQALRLQVDTLTDVLTEVAGGNLRPAALEATSDQSHAGDGPVAALWSSLDTTLRSIRGVVESVQSGADQLAGSVSALHEAASDAAAGHTQQVAAINQTSASMQQLAASAAQIADTADLVNGAALEVTTAAQAAQRAVDDAASQIQAMAEQVGGIAAQAADLDAAGAEIGRILSVIDELADQTNLLALNAAIEAARAGEHGRGFAVVAAEVRALAQRASDSTGQIQQIVARIRTGTQATVAATEDGQSAAELGATLAAQVQVMLDRIGDVASQATGAAGQIQLATRQQTSASDQVVAAMTEVASASEQQAAGQRERAQTLAGLDDLAASLTRTAAVFGTR